MRTVYRMTRPENAIDVVHFYGFDKLQSNGAFASLGANATCQQANGNKNGGLQ